MKTLSIMNSYLRNNFIINFYRYYIYESVMIVKDRGFKALIKERGYKVFFAIFMYYLIRDTIVYILIPFLIARGILG